MAHNIPDNEIERHSGAPSATRVASVVSLHTEIRTALGEQYETFLQGSYKNDTSIRDINDVDIVAIRKSTVSTVFTEERYPTVIPWSGIFAEVKGAIDDSPRVTGQTTIGDKCVKVAGGINADVVPAVRIGSFQDDPIAVYSFRERAERRNFPRVHYANGVRKHASTGQRFKPIVRMLKSWAANHWSDSAVAPSFYLESLVSNVPDDCFQGDLGTAFFLVGYWIEQNLAPTASPIIQSVAGDKDILVPSEWHPDRYAVFHQQYATSLGDAARALRATTRAEAVRCWRAAFNE